MRGNHIARLRRRLRPLATARIAGLGAALGLLAGGTAVAIGAPDPPTPGPNRDLIYHVEPVAVTGEATSAAATSVYLSGVAGPSDPGGNPTGYYFQYGATADYRYQTAISTIGACLPGVGIPSPYCSTPASEAVSDPVALLAACTTYHFRIVASNIVGTTDGSDNTFTTTAGRPIKRARSPLTVRPGHRFGVRITLVLPAQVRISIRAHRHNAGFHSPGTFAVRIRAPRKNGRYALRVVASESCGTQQLSKKLRVR
jgi:hypothetical protein